MSRKLKLTLALLLAVVGAGSLAFAGSFVLLQQREAAALEALAETVQPQEVPVPVQEPGPSVTFSREEELAAKQMASLMDRYAQLKVENPDYYGWLSIQDTNIDYPIMFTPESPEYYLKRNFQKKYSSSGLPFLDGYTDLENSCNTMIYGHNMLNTTMFSELLDYGDFEFYRAHPTIRFDTPHQLQEYEIVAVFRAQVLRTDQEGFRYYRYANITDEAAFQDYMDGIFSRALYDTGITPQFGDQLLTLSTCSYHVENGRFVVVARRTFPE